MEEQRSIVIIGGGISGLALGAYIKDGGFNSIILEKDDRVGGKIKTQQRDGFTFDIGANTTSTNIALEELVKILGIDDQVIRPGDKAGKRYILKKNKLKKVSPKPKDILFSNLLSLGAKWQLFTERYKKPKEEFEDESVGAFFERRFGREIVDRVINPVISGIYAGDPYQLSVQSVFPKLLEYEQQYGSITKALKAERKHLPKREVISFKNGMTSLVEGLVNYIGKENILNGMNVQKVTPLDNGQFAIDLLQAGNNYEIVADVVVFATPSNVTANFLRPISEDMANLLQLAYPKVLVLTLGFPKQAIKKPLDGFGFLNPKIEGKSFLGATANSSFLSDRAPDNQELFTLYIGGTGNQGDLEKQVPQAISEFKKIMKINAEPSFQNQFIWEEAIPQMEVGHHNLVEGLEFFEKNMNNIYVLGNYRHGLSVADCVAGAKKTHGQIIKDYSRQSFLASKNKN